MQTYDPAQVVFTFAGNLITGFAEGSFVEVSRDEDAFTKHVGSDGEVARTRNRNRAGSVKVTLMQTSESNDLLSAQAALDEAAGTGVGSLQVKDLGGTTLHDSPNAWIRKVANTTFAKEAGTREWVIDCDNLSMTVGGTPG